MVVTAEVGSAMVEAGWDKQAAQQAAQQAANDQVAAATGAPASESPLWKAGRQNVWSAFWIAATRRAEDLADGGCALGL